MMPLLLGGVMVAGMLLGRPGHEGLIPSQWVVWAVGDNSFASTLLASLLGAFMYFSTLTEVPIVEGLLGAGMGKGPTVGKISEAQLREIAEKKMPDLNCDTVESAVAMIRGSARAMGLEVVA
ncbi:permease [Methylobacterium organophilum]|nr:permease [Methylobacterium organophilum]